MIRQALTLLGKTLLAACFLCAICTQPYVALMYLDSDD
jgi:hypothetical protein